MTMLRTLLLLCLSLLLSLPAHARDELPDRQALESQLNDLSNRDALTQRQSADKQALEKALNFAAEFDRNREKLAALNKRLREASAERNRLQQQLDELTVPDMAALQSRYQSQPISELVAELNSTLKEMEQQQNALAEVNSALISFQTLPERAQTILARDLSRAEEVRQQLAQADLRDGNLSSAELAALKMELAALESRMELSRRELWSADALQTISELRQRLLEQENAIAEMHLSLLQDEINRQHRARTEQMIADALGELPAKLSDSPALVNALQINRAMADQLLTMTDTSNQLIRDNVRIETSLDRSRQTLRNLNEQIELLRGSLLLSRIIYNQQSALKNVELVEGLEKKISDLRLLQFSLREQYQALADPALAASKLIADNDVENRASLSETLTRILDNRSELISQLDNEISHQMKLAISVQLNQQQLKSIHQTLRNTVREQSFWMPSNRALSMDVLQTLPAALTEQIRNLPVREVSAELFDALVADVWLITPFVIVAALLAMRRRNIKNALARLDADINRVRKDSHKHTPLALLLSMLLDAPVPVLLIGAALVFHGAEGTYQQVTAITLIRLAAVWLVFSLSHRLLARGGIGERHFGWPQENLILVRRRVLAIGAIVAMLLPITSISEHWPERIADDHLGLVILALTNLCLAVLLHRLAMAWPFSARGDLLRRCLAYGFASLPLLLMALALSGYYYTSVKVAGRLLDSFFLLMFWVVLEATARRGLSVAARRLAFNRALAKRAARQEAKDSGDTAGSESIEEPKLDVAQINQQSLRLIRIGLLAGFATVIYLVWADLLGTFGYMDNVVLWESVSGTGDSLQVARTSLGDLVGALVVIVLATLLIRNLPGLLEVLILSRMTLAPGSSYTISTLLKYVIFSIAVVSFFSTLGFEWSKLQWLVAALGVGLGFGLQEIFANFVSGLIILFERPIRIGDTITVGNLSGTVSKIRIRATTIIDFDRKEIIVPNKTFVTDQLVNWSLTDPVTRITLKVGFAYGSDLDKAKMVLTQAAAENTRIMSDPEPQVLFLAFGASTLDHELRVHVKDLSDRLRVTDEMNRRIDQLCKEQGLTIAFNQLDVHLINSKGDSACISGEEK